MSGQVTSSQSVAKGVFNESHWRMLFALLDAAIPSISLDNAPTQGSVGDQLTISQEELLLAHQNIQATVHDSPSMASYHQYLASRPLDDPKFVTIIKETIGQIPPRLQRQLAGILDFMTTRIGSVICGYSLTPLDQTSLQRRHDILQSWQNAWLPLWPALSRSFLAMAKIGWSQSDQLFAKLGNYDIGNIMNGPAGQTMNFDFLEFDSQEEPCLLETDVVIIGSGCGGSVCAKIIAEAGQQVLVVDKGYYTPPSLLPVPVDRSSVLYEAGLQSDDGATTILAGSCWGGGGTVNWSASLETQDFVRQEWANKGLHFFTTADYQQRLNRVCDFMGVNTAYIQHNHRNRILLDGAQKLGWQAKPCPQNSGNTEHSCGHCTFGCRSAEKQGPAVSWLPAAQKAGARFIEGLDISQILFENELAKTATGVKGIWTSRTVDSISGERVRRRIQINAKKVIVACGALHSPLLLMRSGLKNPQIGKNLYMHPTGNFGAVFNDVVGSWKGSILTSVVSEFENLDGKGHGVKIVASAGLPHMTTFTLPWHNALQYKTDAIKYSHINSFCAIARDRDTGSVSSDPDGRPIIKYTPSRFDRIHIVSGLVAIAKICYVQGATELFPCVMNVPSFKCRKAREKRTLEDQEFVQWLARLEREDLNPAKDTFTCAHQMGSCRMSTSPTDGVVDDCGKVWGTTNVYVADASVFPTASGVNPMITTMAIADRIAGSLVAFWR
ncbi:hypothetical protein JX265_007066 [Neoarthrinium moseri]|uniref:Long-chain-alcohol oxidase n=1 Tax=Neoarthrinium moseri TaxID=1658444 RepID=A0A9Q0APR8_9PEZI|nr:hypothetical protein JX265_007066 [Neoarthrinium moseri]